MAFSGKRASQVAISDDFLGALDKLPEQVRPRVREAIRRFYQNPTHPSLNYEAIREASEPRMRSIRITNDYRAIVAHPQGDGTYVLLWVDKHEAAYRWARTHYLSPDDARGLVVVPLSERSAERSNGSLGTASAPAPDAGILAHCTDDQLLQSGVPAAFLPALRACISQDALLGLLLALQEQVAQAVMRLALGDDAVAPSLPRQAPEPTSAALDEPDPIEKALARPESRRRFVMVTSQHELEQALNYPLERWRLFLHPGQQGIVQRRFDGPALVSGGAGTGKTVIGLHRARYLAAHVYTAPDEYVLLTTFTINLAENLAALMESLCGDDQETRQRIQVKHVHSLAKQLRDLAHESFSIIEEGQAKYLMKKAVHAHDTLDLLPSFYVSEWKEFICNVKPFPQEKHEPDHRRRQYARDGR